MKVVSAVDRVQIVRSNNDLPMVMPNGLTWDSLSLAPIKGFTQKHGAINRNGILTELSRFVLTEMNRNGTFNIFLNSNKRKGNFVKENSVSVSVPADRTLLCQRRIP